MQRSILAKRAGLLLLACVFFVYLHGLGRAPLVGADEPRYAQVAREMFARGDLVTPTLGGLNWFEKPALLYWLMIAAYEVFGVSEFSARLGVALSGLACVFLTWWLAGRVERRVPAEMRGYGLACAAVLASSAGLLTFSRGAGFDVVLTAAVTLSLSCLCASEMEEDARRRRYLLAGFYAGVGLALLSKGLVGIILPCGTAALYFLLTRRWPGLARLGVWWGVPLAAAVAAVWYAPVVARHGWEFVDEFFVKHHFSRYVSNRYQHPQPFYFYLPVMALLALPWTLLLGGALWRARGWNLRGEGADERLRVFALAWLVVPVAFFSLSGSKLPGYVMPALPAAALLAGDRLLLYVRGGAGEGLVRATGVLASCIAVGGVVYASLGGAVSTSAALVVAAPSVLTGATCLLWARRRALCAGALVGGSLLTIALMAGVAFKSVAERESVRALVEAAEARGLGALPIIQLHGNERTVEFYGAGRLVYNPDGQPRKLEGPLEVVDFARASGGRVLVLVPLEYVSQLNDARGAETEVLGDNGVHALADVRADALPPERPR